MKAGDLASEVIHDAQRLASLEIALAKREVKDIAVANGIATGLVVAGGLLIMLAVLVAVPVTVVLVPTIPVVGLIEVMPGSWAVSVLSTTLTFGVPAPVTSS